MTLKRFVYPVRNDFGVYRPKIPIIITNPFENISVRQWGLLDTGADSCLFNRFIANETHHNLQGDGVESDITNGVGEETVTVWKHTFNISLLSPDQLSVVWKSDNLLVGCLEHNEIPPILGFEDFLSNFKITFDYLTMEIIIEFP